MAVKVPHVELVTCPSDAEIYVAEARLVANLDHSHIVPVHDVGTHEGQVWLAMEFVVGETLRAWSEAQRHDWKAALSLIIQAGRGVAAAHKQGLLHRDLKPDNIMVTLSTALAC